MLVEAASPTDMEGRPQSTGTRIGKGIIGGLTFIMTMMGLKSVGAAPKG